MTVLGTSRAQAGVRQTPRRGDGPAGPERGALQGPGRSGQKGGHLRDKQGEAVPRQRQQCHLHREPDDANSRAPRPTRGPCAQSQRHLGPSRATPDSGNPAPTKPAAAPSCPSAELWAWTQSMGTQNQSCG